MEAEYLRLKLLSKVLTQFIENSKDTEDMTVEEREEYELATDELDTINERLEVALAYNLI